MRVIVGKERPHPWAQLRFEDVDGMRITAFVTNTARGQLADLELRPRRRARCEEGHPDRQRHRTAQPATEVLRPESDLVRHRRPSRPSSPPLGTQTPATTPVHHPGSHRPHRTTHLASPQRSGTLVGSDGSSNDGVASPNRTKLNSPARPSPNDLLNSHPNDGIGAHPHDTGGFVTPTRQNHTSSRRTDAQTTHLKDSKKDRG